MTACLASVRSLEEANLVAAAGVPWIDLKDPASGALGAVSPAVMREVAATLLCRTMKLDPNVYGVAAMPVAPVVAKVDTKAKKVTGHLPAG